MTTNLSSAIPCIFATLLSIHLSGCGNATSVKILPEENAIVDSSPPAVIGVSPDEDESGIALDADIRVEFNETMLINSLNNSTFSLFRQGNRVAATVDFDGQSAVLRPSSNLQPSTRYSATLSTSISDASGNSMDHDYSWDFYTDGNGWTMTDVMTDEIGNSGYPSIAINNNGDAIAAWHQGVGAQHNIWASHYTAAQGWTAIIELEHSIDSGFAPEVSMNNNGAGIAIWQSSINEVDSSKKIWASLYNPNTGWGSAALLDAHTVDWPQATIDENGDILAAWEKDGHLWSAGFTDSGGWSAPTQISVQSSDNLMSSVFFRDSNGDNNILWLRLAVGDRSELLTRRYAVGSGWQPIEIITTVPSSSSLYALSSLAVTTDKNGNALAIWVQEGDTAGYILSSRYTAAGGWATPEPAQPLDAGFSDYPVLVGESNGNATVAWTKDMIDGSPNRVYANRYTPISGWGTPELINSGTANAGNPSLSVDAQGNTLAAWNQTVGLYSTVWASRRAAAGDWTAPEMLQTAGSGDAYTPQLRQAPSGDAVLIWQIENESNVGLRFSEFTAEVLAP